MERIFNSILKEEDLIRSETEYINNDQKEKLMRKINAYRERHINCSRIEDFSKVPRCYQNDGSKSFPCLLYNGVDNTIEHGYFGQLDNKFYDMCLSVYNICSRTLPDYANDFSKIFTFMGAIPLPVVVPPPSTRIIRRNNDLPDDPSDATLNALRNYVKFFFSSNFYIPDNFVFKIKSTGNPGFPDSILYQGMEISKDNNPYPEEGFRAFKKAIVKKQNEDLGASNEFADCLLSNNLDTLFNKFGVLYMYNDQHRGQPDVSTKVRKGYTIDHWNTDFPFKNEEVTLDKRKVIDSFFQTFSGLNKQYGDFDIKAKKYRFVFAESASSNTTPNLILSVIRENYGKNFSTVFKCGDPDTINKNLDLYRERFNINLRDKDLVCFDITQFDNSISPKMLIAYIKGISDVSEPLANEIAKLSTAPGIMNLPYINLDVKSKRNKIFFSGDPFNLDTYRFGVSPSGTADVSEKAKIICSFFVLYTVFGDNIPAFEKVLKGEDKSFYFMNLGDNNFIICDKKYNIKKKLESSTIFKIDISEENIFGGCVLKTNFDKNTISASYNPGSVLMKILSPERDLTDPMRSSYVLGTEFRNLIANSDSNIALVLESIDKVMFDMFYCSSQINLCRKSDAQINDKSIIYENLQKYVSRFGQMNLSKYFFEILDSGGDKLFYANIYEKLNENEKKIIDNLFFSVLEKDEIQNVLSFYQLK